MDGTRLVDVRERVSDVRRGGGWELRCSGDWKGEWWWCREGDCGEKANWVDEADEDELDADEMDELAVRESDDRVRDG